MVKKILPFALILLLGLGLGAGAVYLVQRESSDHERAALVAKYDSDSAVLEHRLLDARRAISRAEDASRSASAALANYRISVEKRDRERQAELERIIGEANNGGSAANNLSDSLGGDLELARSIAERCSRLADGLRRLQGGG